VVAREARVPSVQKGKSNGVVLLDKFVFQLPIMFMFPILYRGKVVGKLQKGSKRCAKGGKSGGYHYHSRRLIV